MNIRFLRNFIADVIQTSINEQGEIQNKVVQYHIQQGNIYGIAEYQMEGNSARIVFDKNSPIQGLILRIEKDYCDINDPEADKRKRAAEYAAAPRTGGCGGCGR